jgi:hypothetical protein
MRIESSLDFSLKRTQEDLCPSCEVLAMETSKLVSA